MTCAEFEELSGAYVLDAVTPEERAAIEEHLVQCASCTHLLKELHSVVDLLSLAVPQIEPTPELKERVLASLRTNVNVAAQLPVPAQPLQDSSLKQHQPIRLVPKRVPNRRQHPLQRRATFVIAAAVLLFTLLGSLITWNVWLQQQSATLQQQNRSLQNQVIVLTGDVVGQPPIAQATGQLIYIPPQNITLLVMRGLPQMRVNGVYQGWLIKGQRVVSIGLLSSGNQIVSLDFSGNAKDFDAVAVSLEKGPGPSEKPTKVVAVGKITAHAAQG